MQTAESRSQESESRIVTAWLIADSYILSEEGKNGSRTGACDNSKPGSRI